jgi:hypothetical protein
VDGFDTMPTSGYCQDVLNASGYTAIAKTNGSATDAVAEAPAVMYFAGHAMVLGAAERAAALMFETPDGTINGLLGDVAVAPFTEGGQAWCVGDNCRHLDTPIAVYPWADRDHSTANLVVLHTCGSAGPPIPGYILGTTFNSMASVVAARGAGTVLGFSSVIYFPTGATWAQRFWSDLKQGWNVPISC